MDTDRFDRWSRYLAALGQFGGERSSSSAVIEAFARALGVSASRRSVLGALLAAILAPRLPTARTAARQAETCRGSDCPCPCPDPPCFVRAWGAQPFGFPNSVGVAPDGTIYVAEEPHRILRYDAAGTFQDAWGDEGSGPGQFISPSGVAVAPSEGSGPGQFKRPDGVAVAPDGTVYVADTGNNRIQAFCVMP